jgi:hypothetical protein
LFLLFHCESRENLKTRQGQVSLKHRKVHFENTFFLNLTSFPIVLPVKTGIYKRDIFKYDCSLRLMMHLVFHAAELSSVIVMKTKFSFTYPLILFSRFPHRMISLKIVLSSLFSACSNSKLYLRHKVLI